MEYVCIMLVAYSNMGWSLYVLFHCVKGSMIVFYDSSAARRLINACSSFMMYYCPFNSQNTVNHVSCNWLIAYSKENSEEIMKRLCIFVILCTISLVSRPSGLISAEQEDGLGATLCACTRLSMK